MGTYPYGSGFDFLKMKYLRVGSGSTRGLTRGVPYPKCSSSMFDSGPLQALGFEGPLQVLGI